MSSLIRHPKNFWLGFIFLAFGIATIVIGQDYEMGTAGRMGPSYFPSVLGGMLSLVGAASLIRSFFRQGEPIGRLYWRELALVLVAVLLFGFLVRDAGLIPATLELIMISSYAGQKFNLKHSIALAIGAALFAVGLFVKLLGLPMPMLGPWFGGA